MEKGTEHDVGPLADGGMMGRPTTDHECFDSDICPRSLADGEWGMVDDKGKRIGDRRH
jgi:hypothetical protein